MLSVGILNISKEKQKRGGENGGSKTVQKKGENINLWKVSRMGGGGGEEQTPSVEMRVIRGPN